MVISSKPSTSRYQIRSISLPCRSHPSTIRIEQELNKLKTWEASSVFTEKSICDGLNGLTALYKCMEELLNLPLTQQALSNNQNEKWVNELLDGSVKFLDICGLARDMVSQIKEQVRDLRCALRRRKGDPSIEESVAEYISFRKRIKKDAKKLGADLKQADNASGCQPVANLDHHIIAVIRVLVEVGEMTASIFESMLLFFSASVSKPKPTRWSLVSKLIQKGTSACEYQEGFPMNELESVDAALLNLCKNGSSNEGDRVQIAQNRLEEIEVQIESLDGGLECIFRCLIRTRASLLNILSH